MLKEIGKKISFVFDTIMLIVVCFIGTFLLAIVYVFKEREWNE